MIKCEIKLVVYRHVIFVEVKTVMTSTLEEGKVESSLTYNISESIVYDVSVASKKDLTSTFLRYT